MVTAVLAAGASLAWWRAEPMRARSAATLLLLTGVTLTVYTALQCIPMPMKWLAAIAPYNANVWSRALAPLHEEGPRWAPISLDPTATENEVLRGVAYLLAFVTALRVASRRDGVRFLSAVVVATALALALAALLHPAFGAKRLFGLYEPTAGISARHLAPLMNPNNLAGYLNLGLCLALAPLLAPEPQVPRPIAAAVVLLLASAQVWVASRGGVITMALGALIVVVIARLARTRHSGTVPPAALVVGGALVIVTSLFVLSGSDEASNELLDRDVSKFKMFAATVRSIPSMPLFGCGRGSFESMFPAFRVAPGYVTYSYPENVVAQWLVEWGLPIGIAGLAAIAFALRPNVVLARSTTAGGAWAGLAAVTVQNLGDLGTEIPALMLACVICAAIVSAGTPGYQSKYLVERWARRPRAVALCAGVGASAALLLGVTNLGRGLRDDEGAMYQATWAHHVSAKDMRAIARAAMLRHPAEPYLPFAAALRAVSERDDDPVRWLGATLERAAVYGPAHLVLARLVARRSPSQARLEYRLAMEQAPDIVGSVMAEAPQVVRGYFDAEELIPAGRGGASVRESLVQAIASRLPATRVLIDSETVLFDSTAHGPALRFAIDSVEDLDAGEAAPWCQGSWLETCVHDALAKSSRLQQMAPDKCEGYALHARARASGGDAAGAMAELEKAANGVADRLWCLQQLVAVARKWGTDTGAQATLDKIIVVGCGDDESCAGNLRWVGQQYESMGRPHEALAVYRRAFRKVPDDSLLAHTADLAAAAGLHAEAAGDYEQLSRRDPSNTKWRKSAIEQHDEAIRQAIGL
jgi:tetratricopeptide (TPR) repeat protein